MPLLDSAPVSKQKGTVTILWGTKVQWCHPYRNQVPKEMSSLQWIIIIIINSTGKKETVKIRDKWNRSFNLLDVKISSAGTEAWQ